MHIYILTELLPSIFYNFKIPSSSSHYRSNKGAGKEDPAMAGRLPSLDLTSEQKRAAVAEEMVVPTGPEHQHHEENMAMSYSEASQAHIYFKDLKLLAHDNGDSEDDSGEGKDASNLIPGSGESSTATSPIGDGVRNIYYSNSCINSI